LILLSNDEKDSENNNDEINNYLQRNQIKSKIFNDISIDNCVLFSDNKKCKLYRSRLKILQQDHFSKLKFLEDFKNVLRDSEFSKRLKTIYSYEQFVANGVFKDTSFLYCYNLYYAKSGETIQPFDIDKSCLDKELFKSNNDLSSTFSVAEDCWGKVENYSSFRHWKTIYTNSCDHLLKRGQYSSHYNLYHNFLNPMSDEIDKACPFYMYGCDKFTKKYNFYLNKKYKGTSGSIVNLKDENFVVIKYYDDKFCNNDEDYFEKIPIEVIHDIIDKLDSLSLYNLSLTSKVIFFLIKIVYISCI
jgi:hypothetical protein